MPTAQSVPELRLEREDGRLRLEEPEAPSVRGRIAFRAFLFGGPVLLVTLSILGPPPGFDSPIGGFLIGGLQFLLTITLIPGWVFTLGNGKFLRELEVDGVAGRLRIRGSSLGGVFGRKTELDARSIRTLRIESLLQKSLPGVRWGELATLLRKHRGEKDSPYPGAEQDLEDAVLIRDLSPMLRLVVEAADGEASTLRFRVEGITETGRIQELVKQIAETLGLPVVELEWSDERMASVRAGRERRAGGAAEEGRIDPGPAEEVAAGSTAHRLPPVGAGSPLPQNRIVVWEPGHRIVFRKDSEGLWWGCLWPLVLVTSLPLIQWVIEALASSGPGPSPWEVWMRYWPLNFLVVVPLGLALLVSLYLSRPRRSVIDWFAGVAWRQGRLRRRELPLSAVASVLLREDYTTVSREADDPYVFTLELVPRDGEDGKALGLAEARTIREDRREELYVALAPVAAALARSLDVPFRTKSWMDDGRP